MISVALVNDPGMHVLREVAFDLRLLRAPAIVSSGFDDQFNNVVQAVESGLVEITPEWTCKKHAFVPADSVV